MNMEPAVPANLGKSSYGTLQCLDSFKTISSDVMYLIVQFCSFLNSRLKLKTWKCLFEYILFILCQYTM